MEAVPTIWTTPESCASHAGEVMQTPGLGHGASRNGVGVYVGIGDGNPGVGRTRVGVGGPAVALGNGVRVGGTIRKGLVGVACAMVGNCTPGKTRNSRIVTAAISIRMATNEVTDRISRAVAISFSRLKMVAALCRRAASNS